MFLILLGIVVFGCQKNVDRRWSEKAEVEESVCNGEEKQMDGKLDRFTLTYQKNESETVRVIVKFEEATKTEKIFSGESKSSTTEYDKLEELENFINDRILSAEEENSEKHSRKDDQKILWQIQIVYDSETKHFQSFTEYPEYWDELLVLLK